ncbi:GNAT family N-acetyltransferase [Nitratireductor sp. OM-1]|uniref:GNAT family N-acetyltransferase n=1 Tax=Nitratireductor sp. OM-1 TaxID=1756988 RepID=UPI000DDEBFA2|nr:GNAT family N-acetyltransferase [Nitratireductor sp. OM-1]
MSIQIGYSRRAASTQAFAMIAEGWNDLVQEGFTPDLVGTCPVNANSEVIYAVSSDGDVVGVLTWEYRDDKDAYEVTLGYVEPSSRQQRAFTEMFKTLHDRAQSKGVSTVYVPVHPNNEVARLVLAKLKASAVSVVYEHAVA